MTKTDIIRKWVQEYGIPVSQRKTAIDIYNANSDTMKNPESVRLLLRKFVLPELDDNTNNRKKNETNQPEQIMSTESLSESDIRELFDIKTIVKNALENLKEGEFWREPDFIRRNLNGKSGFRSVLESNYSQPYRGKAQGQVFYSHPKSIQKLKEEGVLL